MAFYAYRKYDANTNKGAGTGINLAPPNKDDAKRVSDNKQKITERDAAQANSKNSTIQASPLITYAGQYGTNIEIGSIVNNIAENNGTCTAYFKLGNSEISKSSSGVMNASSVSCPVIVVPVDRFPYKGEWKVTVNYSSSKASGVSPERTISIR